MSVIFYCNFLLKVTFYPTLFLSVIFITFKLTLSAVILSQNVFSLWIKASTIIKVINSVYTIFLVFFFNYTTDLCDIIHIKFIIQSQRPSRSEKLLAPVVSTMLLGNAAHSWFEKLFTMICVSRLGIRTR